jgi:hypothetical protein
MSRQTLHIDGHVHFYSFFDLATAIGALSKRIRRPIDRSTTAFVWLLTELTQCRFFDTLARTESIDGYTVQKTEKESLKLTPAEPGEAHLYIIAGRQLVSRENLEILSLASTYNAENRVQTAADLIRAVSEHHGVPALNWAPGKWMFSRAHVVKQVLDQSTPRNLLIADSTMRPTVWPTPKLMKTAMKRGFKVIAGSDPLPFRREERLIGSYRFTVNGEFDPDSPASSIRSLLLDPQVEINRAGKRSGPILFAERQWKIMRVKNESLSDNCWQEP